MAVGLADVDSLPAGFASCCRHLLASARPVPNRLEILLGLHRAPGICVGDLAAALGRSENAVSQALRVLRQQGWVSSTRVGRAVSYRLEDEIVHDLLHWIGARHSDAAIRQTHLAGW